VNFKLNLTLQNRFGMWGLYSLTMFWHADGMLKQMQ